MSAGVQSRVQVLEQVFTQIALTRMQGVPVQNPALRVQAVGFAPQPTPEGEYLLGILVTPWFMNLVCLPLDLPNTDQAALGVGQKAKRQIGSQTFEFIGAYEDELGAFACCSLFSPMFEFADQATAVATAAEVLNLLRTPAPAVEPVPSRRSFLFGRSSRPGAGSSA